MPATIFSTRKHLQKLRIKNFSHISTYVSAISPDDLKATSAEDRTLTCNIGDVDTAVTVSWKDKDGSQITDSKGEYTIKQGTVDSKTQKQEATLTISSDILGKLGSPVTYTCAAKSTKYPESAISTDQNVVVTILTFRKYYFHQTSER